MNKKTAWAKYLSMLIFLIVGGVCGIWIVKTIEQIAKPGRPLPEIIIFAILSFAMMYLAMLLQIILHETGHLIAGLMSGYQFSSFRILSFMWIRENGMLHLHRLALAGTGGQCLMTPPELKEGTIPYVFYNMGGVLMNLIVSAIAFLLYIPCKNIPVLSVLFFFLGIIGVAFAITNGIPMQMGEINNDGYNALTLGKDKKELQAFWLQMKINEQVAKGIRLKDMPEEWFAMPTDEQMQGSMQAAAGVFCCNRLFDEQRFAEADEQMKHLLAIKSGMVGIHRNLLVCDRICCEIFAHNGENARQLYTPELQKFMKTMQKFPSVLRTQYLYAQQVEQNEREAEKYKTLFENCAKTYPYPSEIAAERELMCFPLSD